MSRLPRRAAVLALSALATGVLLQLSMPAASAATPQQRAAALASKVHSLQQQAEADTEAYDNAEGQLGQVTAQAFAAQQAVSTAQRQDTATVDTGDQAVRQLYELGGPAVLWTSALTGNGNLVLVQARIIAARRILGSDQAAAVASSARADLAVAAASRAAALDAQQEQLEGQVAAQSAQVQATLAQTQSLLTSANAQVAALAAADELAREQSDAAQFAQQLALAQAGEGAYAAQLDEAPPASSPAAAVALAAAQALSGHPYQWGGTGPVGYDCSGMTGAAYAAAGINLPRTAAQQYLSGPHVPLADLEPGDLLFWAFNPADPATIHHTAIYAGNGLMVSADHTGDVVRLQPVWWDGYAGATRPTETMALTVPGPRWSAG
jgi:cell wall-associated NlpC family hydrolase